jgi:hypothetical protein
MVMANFAIIEVDDGLTVAELDPQATPEESATRQGGVLVDPGPYKSYDDAYDAILALKEEEEDDEDAGV